MTEIVIHVPTIEVPVVTPVGVPGPRGVPAEMSAVNAAIAAEADKREAADEALAASVATETDARTAADAAEADARASADAALAAAIQAEGEARDAVDAALQEAIDDEGAARVAADAALQAAIDGLADVAQSGSYNDLADKPVIPISPPIVGRMPPIGPGGLDHKFGPTDVKVSASNQTLTANRLYMSRFIAPEALTLAEIGIRVATGAAGHTCRLGLYAPHTNGLPGALVFDSGDLPVDAAGHVIETLSLPMAAGQILWMACTCSGAPVVLGAASGTAGQPVLGWNLASGAQGIWSILRTRSSYGPLDADESGAVWFTSSSQPSPFVFLDI